MTPSSALRRAWMYGRFAAGLPRFVRTRITLDDARATVRRRLEHRPDRFVRLVERAIYGHRKSPYLPLLEAAGCEPGDLRAMVADRGVEETLHTLRREGVYVTFEEFKGRTPIERNGRVVPTSSDSFDNPLVGRQLEGRTSGSSGLPTRVPYDLDSIVAKAHTAALGFHSHGVLAAPLGLWRDALPSVVGVHVALRSIVLGNPVRRWFAPVAGSIREAGLRFDLATAFIVRACRLLGQPIPRPEPTPLDRADTIARWAESTVRAEGACLLRASPSMALRLGRAAEVEGIDLTGLTIMGGGEPVTGAKIAPAIRAGARFVPMYALSEIGVIGYGCVDPVQRTDLHLLTDTAALIQYPNRVPGTDLDVEAFCLTGLLAAAPRILLNVELDDHGTVEERRCGCPFQELGYHVHLRDIRSHGKLTGEGVTLIGNDMIRILEEVLPARFGGDAHHYQLHEVEQRDGFTRLVLVVDPRIRLPAETEVVGAVLEALDRGSAMEKYARQLWQQAGSLTIERRTPRWNGTKFPALVVRR